MNNNILLYAKITLACVLSITQTVSSAIYRQQRDNIVIYGLLMFHADEVAGAVT
jgi:hypothetical protein